MSHRLSPRMLTSLTLLIGLLTAAQSAPADRIPPDEAPAARAALDAADLLLDRLRQQMPTLIEASELAAEKVIAGGKVCVPGDPALALELSRRPGALALMSPDEPVKGDVLLFAADPTADSLDEARRHTDHGVTVILLASRRQLDAADLLARADAVASAMIDTAAGDDLAPLAPAAHLITAWCFQAELASALTRRGRIPLAWSAPAIPHPTTRESLLIEDPNVTPIPAGQWAEQYLHAMHSVLHEIGGGSWDNLARAARKATRALRAHRNVYLASVIPYAASRLSPDDSHPAWLRYLDLRDPGRDQPARGDFVIALGRDERPGTEDWGPNVSLLRRATAGVAWVCIDIGSPRERAKKRDVRINPGYPADDAVIKLPSPGARIAPVSTPAAEIVLAAILAQVQADLDKNPIRP
ncbi:MAG: hypothetical protein IT442_00900 [Phycisphaeraceae bacterium]|nr:hypothetical protein [Phycisphaeraceae bacterium]